MHSYELAWAAVGDGRPERERLRAAADGAAFLTGRALLGGLVGRMTGLQQHEITIVATCPDCGGEHGRPELPGTGLHLGLTHAGSTAVAVASWLGPIGVDAEPLDVPPARIAAIGTLTGIPSLQHWTRVEAVLKADGRGLRVDPALVQITETADGVSGWITGDAARYSITEPRLPGLQVAVALLA